MKFFLLTFLLSFMLPGHCQEAQNETNKSATNEFIEVLKKSDGKLDLSTLSDPKMMMLFKRSFQETNLHKMSPELVKEFIMIKVRGRYLEQVFLRFPKLLDITAALLLDKEALPAILGVLSKRDELNFVAICSIVLVILGYFLGKQLVSKDTSWVKRIATQFGIQVFVTVSIFYIFYHTFQKELGPALRVISKHL